jgi:hypothetical protein
VIQRLYKDCGGYTEIRKTPSGKQMHFPVADLEKALAYCMQPTIENVFFGVATRDGNGGKKENIVHIPAVWNDADFKITPKSVLRDNIAKLPFRASVVNETGGGYHLYWILDEPAGPDDIPLVENLNHAIADILGGDHNACDAARVLRVPDTINQKYDNKPVVTTVFERDFTYNLEDLANALGVDDTPRHRDPERKNPEGWLVEALAGVDNGRRNATGAKIAGYFINKLPADDVLTILTAWNNHNNPPLPVREIQTIVKSIRGYKTNNTGKPNERKNVIRVSFG